jgi:hypothetical protein
LKRRDNFSRIFCEHNIYWISGRFKRANWSDVRLTDFHSFFYYRTLFLFPKIQTKRTFQNMCFQISDIAKHVLWHHILYWEWEEESCPANCQKSLRCRSHMIYFFF